MIRKLALAIGVGIAMLFGSTAAAYAADAPPADTTITYAPGSSSTIVMLDTNLTAAQRADITTYNIRVVINNQPTRNLSVTKLPTTLFNIVPGTRLHAYLTVKGDFGTSQEYDGGTYTAGASATSSPTSTPTRVPVTPAPSPTQTSVPTATLAPTTQPTVPATSTPTVPVVTPAPTTAPTRQPTTDNNVATIVDNHFTPILIIAIITAIILSFIAIFIRRRA